MCNFNKQPDDTKAFMHLFMKKAADSVGGVNYLLSLIEAMKTKRPHPLMRKECKIASNNTIIEWNKVVFQDKVDVIEEILTIHRSSEEPDFNILAGENSKRKKKIINMVRTLQPLEFIITPQNPNDGSGFSFKVFDDVTEERAVFNPVFIAFFFCSAAFTKLALQYEI